MEKEGKHKVTKRFPSANGSVHSSQLGAGQKGIFRAGHPTSGTQLLYLYDGVFQVLLLLSFKERCVSADGDVIGALLFL